MTLLARAFLAAAPLLAAGSLACATPALADSPKAFVVGLDDESYPPFFSKAPDGTWVGWEIDMIHAVCQQMGAECTFKPMAWDGLIPALQQKQIDIIWGSMTINGERQKVIDFTHAYYDSPVVIIGDKSDDTKVDCNDLASFKGKVIGVENATNFSDFLKTAPAGVQVKAYDTMDHVLADLSSGRIDYAIEGVGTFAPFLKKNPDFAAKTTCADNPVLGLGDGGGVRKDDTALRDAVSAAIVTIEKNGTWDAITAKYPELQGGAITKP